jgi:TP901 family phage tail tape measure protein
MDREYFEFVARFVAENFGEASRVAAGLAQIGDEVQGLGAEFGQAESGAHKMASGLGTILGVATKVVVGLASISAAMAYLSGSMQMAIPFDAKLAETSTLIAGTAEQMTYLEDTARSMAREFGTNATEQIAGFYEALSAGVGGVMEATAMMEASNKLAIGGVTTQAAAVDLLTTATNAYKREALTAADASDILFVGVMAGKTTAEQLSASLGQLVPIASAVGLGFDEAVAGVAALTTQGQSTSMAITGMRGIMTALIKPTSEASKAAKEMGLEFSTAALRSKGLEAFLEDVIAKSGGSSEALSRLFTDVEGLNAVLSFTGGGGDALASTMDMMRDRAGATDVAFNKVADSLSHRLNVQMALFKDVSLAVGQVALSIVVPALETFTGAVSFVAENLDIIVAVMVGLAATAIPALVTAITGMTTSIGFSIIAAGLLTGTLSPLALASGVATAAVTALSTALRFLGGPMGLLIGAGVGLGAYFLSTRESARSLDQVMADAAVTTSQLSSVSEKLSADYAELTTQKKALEDAEATGSQAAQNAATLAIAAIDERINKNKELQEQLAIIKREEVDQAQRAFADQADAMRQELRQVFADAEAEASALETGFNSAFGKVAMANRFDQLYETEGIDGVIARLQDLASTAQLTGDETKRLGADTVTAIVGMIRKAQELGATEEDVRAMEAALAALEGAGAGAAGGLNAAAGGANNLAGAAMNATGAMSGLMAMMPGFQAAMAMQGQLSAANNLYKEGVSAVATEVDAGTMSFERAAQERARLTTQYNAVVSELDGTAKAARSSAEALKDYADEAHLSSLPARDRAIEQERREFDELTKSISKTVAVGAERDAAIETAAEAHGLRMKTIEERFASKGGSGGGNGGGAGKVAEANAEIEAYGRLSEVVADYHRETSELVDTMFLDGETRAMRADYMRMEQELQAKGITMTAAEADALQRLVEDRRRAVQENERLLPQLYQALDEASRNIADASDVASSLVGTLSDSFDNVIDHILEKGFSDMSGLADIFGTAFKQMGSELIKFALQAMILQPILERLKSAMSGGGSGGGGGFFGFLGSLFGGIFGGGTRTVASAKGNVFKQSQTIPMALMGEAGDEALMPLTRTGDGTLAVRSIGGDMSDVLSAMREVAGLLQRATLASQGPSGYGAGVDTLEQANGAERRSGARDGGIHIGTYAPSYHIETSGGAPGAGNGKDDQTQSEGLMKSLDAHMRAAFAEFITEQQRNGGMFNPAVRPYG